MGNTFHIQWHITDNCNLRCKHCYQENFTNSKDLPVEKLYLIFENISEFLKVKNKKLVIDLTGGEVFLYPEWRELVKKICSSIYLKHIGIITNGLLLNDEILEEFERYNIKLKISAEGVERQVYEYFRGKNFDKFLKICEKIKEMKIEKIFMFTLLEKNYDQIFKIFDFLGMYKFDKLVIERFIPYGIGKKMKNEFISYEKWFSLAKFLHEKCNLDFNPYDIAEFKGFMVEIKNGNYNLYGSECVVGRYGIAIMPDGTVFPCRRFPLSIGNLLKDKLLDLWEKSDILNMLRERKFLKGICKDCKIKNCYGCRAIGYSLYNDFLHEDILCFLKLKKEKKDDSENGFFDERSW